MSAWFFMLGEPLGPTERKQVQDYLHGLGVDDEVPAENVPDWNAARAAITNPEWDRRWWDAERRERAKLHTQATAACGEAALLQTLSAVLEQSLDAAHGAAAVQAARGGCADPALIRAAAAAVSESLFLSELRRLAGESDTHPFAVKHALFTAGHWPLGIVGGRYYVF